MTYLPDNKKFYLFKGDYYARHSQHEALDPGYPLLIKEHWDGWPITRQDFDTSVNALSYPTFRYGAGALLDSSGRLNLIGTERCIPAFLIWMPCASLNTNVDYFILKP